MSFPSKPGRHVDFFRISSKMNQRPLLEVKQRSAWIAIILKLPDCVTPGLPCSGILELDRRNRKPVQCENHIQCPIVARMARDLPRNREPVLGIKLRDLWVGSMRRFEIRKAKCLSIELEPVTQNMERALCVQFLDQRGKDHRLQPAAVKRHHLSPKLRLRFLDEGNQISREKCPILVPMRIAALGPSTGREEDFLYIALKGSFGRLG